MKKELARVTQAFAIDNLTSIATSLSNVKQDLSLLKNTTLDLKEVTQYLRNGEALAISLLYQISKKYDKSLPFCLSDAYAYGKDFHLNC